jgi:hypothetical protein
MLRRSRRQLRRRARRARPKPVLAQALPRRWSQPPRRRAPHRARSARPGPHLEEPRGPPAEVWVAVPAASKARAGHQRQGQRRQEVAVGRRARLGPTEWARWAVVRAPRAVGPGREAAWEPKAAQPTGCWLAVGSGALSAAAGLWADRQRPPSQHLHPVRLGPRRPGARTDSPERLHLRSTATTGARWGC